MQRAKAEGKTACTGSRPRCGRDRFQKHYRKLRLSHGVVSHNAAEWSTIKDARIYNSNGKSKVIQIKCGTEVADGTWAEVKSSYPYGIRSRDHEKLAEYINAWAWRARRHGDDFFKCLGKAIQT